MVELRYIPSSRKQQLMNHKSINNSLNIRNLKCKRQLHAFFHLEWNALKKTTYVSIYNGNIKLQYMMNAVAIISVY